MLPGFPVQAAASAPPVLVERTGGVIQGYTDEEGTYYPPTTNILVNKTVAIGELVLVALVCYQNYTINTSTAGWTKLVETADSSGGLVIFSRIATATTISLTVTYKNNFGTAAEPTYKTWTCVRIAGANQVAASTIFKTAGTTNADPPQLTLGASRNALWFLFFAGSGTAWNLPSSYTSWLFYGPPSIGWNLGTASKQAYLASDDPAAITPSGSAPNTDKWACTLACWKG